VNPDKLLREEEMLYYIRSIEHEYPKGIACWWRPNSRGYTNDLHQAGLYTETEAKEICYGANLMEKNEEMIPRNMAEACAGWRVDTGLLGERMSGLTITPTPQEIDLMDKHGLRVY
jgi:hypothetical protein